LKFKYYFNYLSLREKILAFLTIPLLLFLLFSVIEKPFLREDKFNITNQIKIINLKIQKIESSIVKPNNILAIKLLEDIAEYFKVQILDIKINRSYFDIKLIGIYQNIMNFLIYIELNMETKSLQIFHDGNNTILHGKFNSITLEKIDNLITVKNIPNPFIKTRSFNKVKKNNRLKLVAIFDKLVCINDKWYKKDDKINKYTIKNIFINHIELIKNNKIIRLEIYKDE